MDKIINIVEVKKREGKRFDNLLGKVELTGKLFMNGFANQIIDEETIAAGLMVGLHQGLKYNGSLVRGVKGGLATAAVVGSVNGFVNIVSNREVIKQHKQ